MPKTNHNKDFTEIKNTVKTTTCNVFNKWNKTIDKRVVCKTSFSPRQRVYWKLKLSDIQETGRDKKKRWKYECLTQIQVKIFHSVQ